LNGFSDEAGTAGSFCASTAAAASSSSSSSSILTRQKCVNYKGL
jgi:hypothetical protein